MNRSFAATAKKFNEASLQSWLCSFLRAENSHSRRAGLKRRLLSAVVNCLVWMTALCVLLAFWEVPARERAATGQARRRQHRTRGVRQRAIHV